MKDSKRKGSNWGLRMMTLLFLGGWALAFMAGWLLKSDVVGGRIAQHGRQVKEYVRWKLDDIETARRFFNEN